MEIKVTVFATEFTEYQRPGRLRQQRGKRLIKGADHPLRISTGSSREALRAGRYPAKKVMMMPKAKASK